MYRPKARVFRGFVSLLALTIWSAAADAQQPAFTQAFQSQGPAPSVGPLATVQSGDIPPNGTVAGGIQAVLPDPVNPDRMYVGANNGGIWMTTNGGINWTPLTDKHTSLAISSLSFDTTDATNQTIVASTGNVSNGHVGGFHSGNLAGLLYTTNGGTSWTELGAATFDNVSLAAAAARGSTILAAAGDPNDVSAAGGLYRSDNGGTSFSLVSGLTAGQVTALASDSGNRNYFYAAVSATDTTQRGIYASNITGSTWTRVLAMDSDEAAKVVTGSIPGSVVAAFYNVDPSSPEKDKLTRIMLSVDSGQTWKAVTLPGDSSGQAATNTALAIDPHDANIVYIAGAARTSGEPTLSAYRLILNADGTTTAQILTDEGTANGSTAHADARTFVFDSHGNLILGGDGGIFVRSSPADDSGAWTGLNSSTLSVREINALAYDAISHRLIVAAQDNGVAFQDSPGSSLYRAIGGADGTNAVVNDRTLADRSAIYTTIQHLDLLTRWTYNAQGVLIGERVFGTGQGSANQLNFEADDYKLSTGTPDPDDPQSSKPQLPFNSRMILNRQDPTKIAFGTNYVYTTQDAGASSSTLTLLNRGQAGTVIGEVSALAYGTVDNPDVVLAGTTVAGGGRLYLSTSNTANSLTRLTAYASSEPAPVSLVFDNRFASTFFVANTSKLMGTTNSGTSFTDLTANLTALDIYRPTAVEFISNNGVNALLVGGLVNVAAAQSPIAVVNSDGAGNLDPTSWKSFGAGLPNTMVNAMGYNSAADVLVTSLWGRGAWVMYDVTSYFSTATVLKYGLADNDSAPDASFLTGARPLVKYGTGTLTIAGTSSYTGSTTVNDGTLVVDGSLASSSNLQIEAAGTVRGTGTLPQTTVNGTLAPGNNAIGTLTVNNGLTFNGGSTYQIMASSTAASLTNVTGGAASLGGTVQAILQPGSFRPSRSFTILTATGGMTGTFAGATSNYPFLQPSLSYDANDVMLTVTPGGFARGARTPNQAAVGGVLDANVVTASGDFATVIDAFSLLSAEQAPAAFEAVSGQNYAGFATIGVQTAQLFMNSFAQQAGTGSAGSGSAASAGGRTAGRIALAEACDVACDLPEYRWSAWGGALGGVGTVAGSAAASGLNFGIGGFAAGLDRRFDSGFLFGVTAGYASAAQSMQAMPGRGTTNTGQLGLYASRAFGAFYVDALAGYAHSDSQMFRPISIPGLAQRTATGQTSANQFFGQIESGYRLELDGAPDSSMAPFVTPFVRLQGSTATQAGFTESGADSLDLTVAAQTTNSLRSVLGSQLGGAIDLGWRDKLGLVVRLGWSHEYADTSRPVNASFAGAPASPFTVAGAEAPRDGAIVGLAASTAIAETTSVYLRYDGEMAGGNTSHVFSAGVRLVW